MGIFIAVGLLEAYAFGDCKVVNGVCSLCQGDGAIAMRSDWNNSDRDLRLFFLNTWSGSLSLLRNASLREYALGADRETAKKTRSVRG